MQPRQPSRNQSIKSTKQNRSNHVQRRLNWWWPQVVEVAAGEAAVAALTTGTALPDAAVIWPHLPVRRSNRAPEKQKSRIGATSYVLFVAIGAPTSLLKRMIICCRVPSAVTSSLVR